VTVADQSAPVISDLAADPPVLRRREHHRMEIVTIAYSTTDNCGSVTTELTVSTSGSDDDAADRRGRRPDVEIVDAHHVRLAVERDGHDDRLYTITVAATDAAGNRSTGVVSVPVAGNHR
jgi:hypothetical protein